MPFDVVLSVAVVIVTFCMSLALVLHFSLALLKYFLFWLS